MRRFKWSSESIDGRPEDVFEANNYWEACEKVLEWSGICVEEVKSDLKWIVATHRKNLEKKDMFYNSVEEAQAQNPDFYNFTMVGTEEQFKRFDEQEVSVEQVKSVKVPKKRNVGTFWNKGLWGQK
jgi:hypothetical protein|tara:strand:- start:1329 stop:1706 length:378 start_codon:yes stop_codon:yes gene_type:complete